jgi:hypothetical protein
MGEGRLWVNVCGGIRTMNDDYRPRPLVDVSIRDAAAWLKQDQRWFGVGFILTGILILGVIAASPVPDDRNQRQVDRAWRQFISDASHTTFDEAPAERFDCEWMRDILAGRKPTMVFTPGTTPQLVDGNWPSRDVAREYLVKLC